ncbi:sulfotransferase family protein [Mumia flava]|uniref:Sulfotransferase family protein n=1 Tax=Mumia flava TaxID=1348852 RepID=A0A0B2BBP5_9ACTN|nr:sulfotransferase family 2 domain-containing protein [Mumia flava]PJJ58339.1 sulfotransferase family protein [Mumia flava]
MSPSPLARNAFILPEHRIEFVSIAKNACTSLQWMLADLAGEDLAAFRGSTRAEVSPRMTIHDRSRYRHVLRPAELDDDQQAQVRPDNGWFCFAVVRDPRVRAFSAWQSKFLQRDPIYMRLYGGEPWIPRIPQRPEDVLEDFASFVRVFASDRGHRLHDDPHFRLQTSRIDDQAAGFSRVYDVSELGELTSDLAAHLVRIDKPAEPTLGRENDTALAVHGALFADGVRELLEQVYAPDLAAYGERWDFDRVLAREPVWAPEAFRDIASRATMGERIGDLARIANALRAENRDLADRLARAEARVERLRSAKEQLRSAREQQADRLRTLERRDPLTLLARGSRKVRRPGA